MPALKLNIPFAIIPFPSKKNVLLTIRTILVSLILFLPPYLLAQVPTVQDCMGAIPICQPFYSEANSYSGMGNYQNEINGNVSCSSEDNSVWYIFTAQTTGNFSFIITPNNTVFPGDDYDWTAFDLTNADCSDIYNNPSLEISCNSYGTTTGFNGQTGASTAMGGTDNFNGPDDYNGPPWNADIPVVQGGTYVLMVSNWTGSPYGYTIDFSSSTASLYDNVPPQIHQIVSNIACGTNSITFEFSENILCSTVSACDITLTGPGGPYTVNSISGTACTAGGTQEKTFTINFSPAIYSAGNFNLNLDNTACSSVTDLCGNIAPAGSLPFTVSLINTTTSTTDATCTAADGSATVNVIGGSGNYSYIWNTVPPQNTATASNLTAGTYFVTVSDGNCTGLDSATVISTSAFSATVSVVDANCGMADGSATVSTSGGIAPYTYNWSSVPPQNTQTATTLPAGNYTVSVTDGNGCTATIGFAISVGNIPVPVVGSTEAHCGQADGSATVNVSGGTGNYSYIWSNDDTTSSIQNLLPGTYSVTVDDGNCTAANSVTVANDPGPVASFTYHPKPVSINSAGVTFTCTSSGVTSWEWNFGDSAGVFFGETVVHTFAAVGTYNVSLIVTDAFGCSDTITERVEVHDIFTIYIPSSFTPDGDALNDVFGPVGINWEEGTYEMAIYNRWGNQVFKTTDWNIPWNGGFNNNPSRSEKIPGVYV